MRIAYGIHGYGRGHAMRAMAVLPELTRRHEVLMLAGGDAHAALGQDHRVIRVPMLRYHYNRRRRIAPLATMKHMTPLLLDVWLRGPTLACVMDTLEDFRPDVVISDSEIYSHHAARVMRIPRITFDHFGFLVYCRPEMSRLDRIRCRLNALVYRRLFGEPERIIVSSFFDAPPIREGIRVVGPVIRPEVRRVQPSRREHLMVYLSMGRHEYTDQIEQALLQLDCPVLVYGTDWRGQQGNLQFKPIANQPFIEDLAGCRAVFATTGNQLLGEVIHFGKPILGMPIDCLEQRLNAAQIERMGIGMAVRRGEVTADLLRGFLTREEEFAGNARGEARDGAREAIEAIETFAAELIGSPTSYEARKERIPAAQNHTEGAS